MLLYGCPLLHKPFLVTRPLYVSVRYLENSSFGVAEYGPGWFLDIFFCVGSFEKIEKKSPLPSPSHFLLSFCSIQVLTTLLYLLDSFLTCLISCLFVFSFLPHRPNCGWMHRHLFFDMALKLDDFSFPNLHIAYF